MSKSATLASLGMREYADLIATDAADVNVVILTHESEHLRVIAETEAPAFLDHVATLRRSAFNYQAAVLAKRLRLLVLAEASVGILGATFGRDLTDHLPSLRSCIELYSSTAICEGTYAELATVVKIDHDGSRLAVSNAIARDIENASLVPDAWLNLVGLHTGFVPSLCEMYYDSSGTALESKLTVRSDQRIPALRTYASLDLPRLLDLLAIGFNHCGGELDERVLTTLRSRDRVDVAKAIFRRMWRSGSPASVVNWLGVLVLFPSPYVRDHLLLNWNWYLARAAFRSFQLLAEVGTDDATLSRHASSLVTDPSVTSEEKHRVAEALQERVDKAIVSSLMSARN
jgi:hypothetical protein